MRKNNYNHFIAILFIIIFSITSFSAHGFAAAGIDIFGMGVGNHWLYDSNVKRQITGINPAYFPKETFEMEIIETGAEPGKEWYESINEQLFLWGVSEDGMLLKFDKGLLVAWATLTVGEVKSSSAWVINYNTTVNMKVEVLTYEKVPFNNESIDAYRLRYTFTASGPGGTATDTWSWWVVPYLGVIKQQTPVGEEKLISFAIDGGTLTADTDTDTDGVKDYLEIVLYNTDPNNSDSDGDSLLDGDEINLYGTDPNAFDTDNDGLGDGDEIITYKTDPNDLDSDDDGLSDGDEINIHNTDPKSTDSDSDGMPDGWEVTYGLNPLVNDALEDLDGDGISNIEEYNATTNPNNGNIASKASLYLPVENSTEVALSPTLETENYNGTAAQTKTQWQISMADSTADDDFSQIVFNLTNSIWLESVTVPEFVLEPNQLYSWRARFYDINNGGVVWSDTRWFTTTANTDINPDTGVPDSQAIPNGTVDLNDDGILDIISDTYKFVNSADFSGQVGVEVGGGTSIDCLKAIALADVTDNTGKPGQMPLGLVQFKLAGVTPGATVSVEVYFSEAAPAGAKWYKFDSVNGWQDYSAHATFSADRKSITLELKDGDYGDCDETENGTIIDPSGLGTFISDGIIGGGGGGGGCFITALEQGDF